MLDIWKALGNMIPILVVAGLAIASLIWIEVDDRRNNRHAR